MARTRKPKPVPASDQPAPPSDSPPLEHYDTQESAGSAPADFKKARRQKETLDDPTKIERLPPHSIEAEQGVLGCIGLSPKDCIPLCIEKLIAGGPMFYDLRHRTIYEQCLAMWDADKPIDLITLQQALKDKQQLESVGGLAYLSSLPDSVPSAANLDYYLEIVREKYSLRTLVSLCTEVVGRAYEHQGEVDQLIEEVDTDIRKIVDGAQPVKDSGTMKLLVPTAMDHIDKMRLKAGKVTGLPTGLVDLDMLTWGLQPAEMIVLAARPSVGKTSLAMNIAEYAAIHEGQPVGVFSLEMSEDSLMVRMICSRAHVSTTSIRKGYASDKDYEMLVSAGKAFHKAPIHIDDSSALSIQQLRARAKRMHQKHGVRLIVVDYLQLMTAPTRRSDNRQQEVSQISSGLKALAKDLKIPVLVLSQLSRKLEDRGANATPKLSDLRESGSIEQDADVVILLHRPEKESAQSNGTYQEAMPITAIVAKNRNGTTGEANLVFLRYCTRYENAAKITADEVPQDDLPM